MQRHPVYLLLPPFPVPESHGIGEGAVVEVVAQREVGFMPFFPGHWRQRFGDSGLHPVPRQVYAGIVFQIPVHAGGDIHPGVSSHDDLLPALVKFEEICISLYQLRLEFRRRTFIDTFQHIVNRVGRHTQGKTNHCQ